MSYKQTRSSEKTAVPKGLFFRLGYLLTFLFCSFGGNYLLAANSVWDGGNALSIAVANGNSDLILSFRPAPVPESSTYLLIGFGLLILGSVCRKRRV